MADRDEILTHLAQSLFEWNTPTDPYFVINGRTGEGECDDPYMPIARAALAALEAKYGEIHAVRVLTCERWQEEHHRLISACTHDVAF